MRNDVLNTTELMTGKDGKLFCTVNNTQYFLAEVNQYAVTMDVATTDVQPVGSIVSMAVPTGVTFNLSFTEMVVRDDVMAADLLENIRRGYVPVYHFQGSVERADGDEQRMTFNNAVPSGTFGLQSLQPGEVVSRENTFRLNSVPSYINKLASKYLN